MAIETTQRYCPICGKVVDQPTYDRFGEWCCSQAHADDYVAEVRAQKQRQTETRPSEAAPRRRGCC